MSELVYKPLLELQSRADDEVVLNLTIPENLYYFQGHFPEAAILPGVTQLSWVMDYLNEYFNQDVTSIASVDILKFQHIVRPEYLVELKLVRIKPNKYTFSYHSEHGQHSSGRVVFNS